MTMAGFATARLTGRVADVTDCVQLAAIEASWTTIEAVTGRRSDGVEGFVNAVTAGDLPPDGQQEKFTELLIFDGTAAVGLLALYEGYPAADVLWIGELVIDGAARGRGYGRELVMAVCDLARREGFARIQLGVHLKNWTGLRFWTAVGFDRIVKVTDAADFPILILEFRL